MAFNKQLFVVSQYARLQALLKATNTSVLAAHFHLKYIAQEPTFDAMHDEFSENVPIVSLIGFINHLRTLTLQAKEAAWEVISVPHLLTKKPLVGTFVSGGGAYPFSEHQMEKSFAVEERLVDGSIDGLSKISGRIFHITDEMSLNTRDDLLVGHFRRARMNFVPKSLRGRVFPDPKIFDDIGESRYQRLHRIIDEMESYGNEIEVVLARPQMLCDLAVILSQRNGEVTTLNDLCPNLKVLAHYAEPIIPYVCEIDDFLKGSKAVKVKVLFAPSGLLAVQSDIHKMNMVELMDDTGVFYEFIPTAGLRGDGSVLPSHDRYHVGNVIEGHEYLLSVSNLSGLLGYNTKRLVRVIAKEPCVLEYVCFANTLNYFGENIRLDALENMIGVINKSAQGHGFHIREYMIGDDVNSKKAYWLFELNRPVSHINPAGLQSIANAMHQEMCLKNPKYKDVMSAGKIGFPNLVFVPMGTFSALSQSVQRQPIDDTEDASLIKKVLELTPEKILIQPQDL